MPIYEYRCPHCDHKFDLLRSFSQAEDPPPCPECATEAKRLISRFSSFSKTSNGASSSVGGGRACGSCTSSGCATCR